MSGVLEGMFAEQAKAKPSGMLDRLKNAFRPSSPVGIVGNRDMYNKYVLKAGEAGEDVVSFEDFIKSMQAYQGNK